MLKLVILITGLPGSGKSTAAEFIKKNFNAAVFHSGDVIRDEIKRRGLKYTPETDAFFAHWFHIGGRERLIANRTWDKVKKSKKKIAVIEGFRSSETLYHFKRASKTRLIVIFIKASFKVRVKREIKRKRFGKAETIDYLRSRERLEKDHGILKLIKKADFVVDNSNLTKKQTEKRIVELMKRILQ